MVMKRRAPFSDPEFAAEMERLREENRQRFLSRLPGDGIVDAGDRALKGPEALRYPSVDRLRSVLKPTGEEEAHRG